ncbi:soluble lytic murein transglycosylase [Aliiroseovarius halocynthiae]|uniref:Lytic transglycosylase domain-containing protein n=1 Tax=Aliiroseovarius halocynthiae TaxID=985055 RepID=A0A545SN58_9RHOB|nr:lytic transglycosylase domain-containing protein [Aliiroseovarius halocynthiae]TQV66394.1 lytic transglycosylase domain-containing protein [Aliiroseovarius halocynthiae]SMR83372.1 soluble lytic murein transglycosylase [Aliiroseovarius halocynthiae]
MNRIKSRLIPALTLVTGLGFAPLFPATAQDARAVSAFETAIQSARNGDWDTARSQAAQGGALAADILEWDRLRQSKGSFADTRAFLKRHPDWPGLKLLRKRSEKSIPHNHTPSEVLAFFEIQPPQTGRGALRLAEALKASGKRDQANAQIIQAWQTLSLDEDEHSAFVSRYTDTLKPHHWTRADMLLWRGASKEATRMMPLLSSGQQALTKARIALRKKQNGVDAMIKAVPASLADDPGLAYERFLWRASKGRNQDAADLLLARSTSAQSLGEPERWGSWRRVLARWSMRDGKNKQAYRLASSHHISSGSSRNDLEWLAGYVALRKLNDPKTASAHFKAFQAGVETPISLGRAGYWNGRAYEALGDTIMAQAAYEFGAEFQTSFYGLLAAEKAGLPMDPRLTGSEPFPSHTLARFWGGSVMEAARLLQAAGELYWAERFSVHLAESLTREEIGQLAAWAESVDEPHLQVMIAKQAARQGHTIARPYFPTPDIGRGNRTVPRALELAIARRESEFDPSVVSGVGARGLMQLMPGTASDMAKRLDMPYSKAQLTEDPAYNTRLGSEYLAKLIEDFNGNPVLISVGYNAGPGRSRSWTERFGNVRSSSVDIIDWIEHIPFRETRNYVMRVTESLPVYRARLTGKTEPLNLSKELKK